jgi:hypothetical protein
MLWRPKIHFPSMASLRHHVDVGSPVDSKRFLNDDDDAKPVAVVVLSTQHLP